MCSHFPLHRVTYTPDLAFENDTSVSAIREGDWANLRYKQVVVVA